MTTSAGRPPLNENAAGGDQRQENRNAASTSNNSVDARRDFFNCLFAGVTEGYVVFGHHEKVTPFIDKKTGELRDTVYRSRAIRVAKVAAADPKHDVYFSVNVLGEPPKKGKRGCEVDVKWLTSLNMDIDLFGKDTEKTYPTEEVARAALADMPLAPSILVRTKGGIHPYWLFDKPHDDWRQVKPVNQAWQALYRTKIGCDLDSTHDASRVLKIPQGIVVVEELHADRRYSLSDFEKFLPVTPPVDAVHERNGKAHQSKPVEAVQPSPLESDELLTLMDNCPEFAEVFTHRKTQKGQTDKSLSGWDWQLGKLLANEVPREKAVALIVKHREQWGEKDYADNVRKANYAVAGWDQPEVDTAAFGEMPPEDAHKARLRALSEHLGVEVARVVQYGKDPDSAITEVHFADGAILDLGKSGNVLSQANVARRVAVTCRKTIRTMKPVRWAKFLDGVFFPLVELEDRAEFSDDHAICELADQYLDAWLRGERISAGGRDKKSRSWCNLESGEPWYCEKTEEWGIHLETFADYLRRNYGKTHTAHKIGPVLLRSKKWEKRIAEDNTGGGRKQRRYWFRLKSTDTVTP